MEIKCEFLEFFLPILNSILQHKNYKFKINSENFLVSRRFKIKKSSQVRCKGTCFYHFKSKYLVVYTIKVLEISSTHFNNSLGQDPMIRYGKKTF